MTGNIKPFSSYNLNSVPECLELLAQKIRLGEEDIEKVVVITYSPEGRVDYKCFGKEPFTRLMALGMCTIASQLIGE